MARDAALAGSSLACVSQLHGLLLMCCTTAWGRVHRGRACRAMGQVQTQLDLVFVAWLARTLRLARLGLATGRQRQRAMASAASVGWPINQ